MGASCSILAEVIWGISVKKVGTDEWDLIGDLGLGGLSAMIPGIVASSISAAAAGAGAPLLPTDFAGLHSWYDASFAPSRTELAPTVGRVAQLDSRGGAASGESARQGSAGSQPRSDAARVGSLAALHYDGLDAANDRLECQADFAFGPASPTTGFLVVYVLSDLFGRHLLTRSGAGASDQIMVQQGDALQALGGTNLTTGLSLPGRFVFSWRQDGATHRFYVNGTETFAGSLAHTNRTVPWVLGNAAGSTNFNGAPDMLLCEAAFYAALLSTTDHTALVTALLAKWGGELAYLSHVALLAGGGPVETLPTAVAGLHSWFDASHAASITKDGSDLISRIDSRGGSATGEFADQAASTRRPVWTAAAVNGKDALRFDGDATADDLLRCHANFTMGGTSASSSGFVVIRQLSEQHARHFLHRAGTSTAPFAIQGAKITSENDTFDYVTGLTWPGTWVISWRESAGNIQVYLNGTKTYDGPSGLSAQTTPFVLGNLDPAVGLNRAFDGYWCEAAFWPSLISQSDHDAVVATAVTKWAG